MSDNRNAAPGTPEFDSIIKENIWLAGGQKPKKISFRLNDLYDSSKFIGKKFDETAERDKWLEPGRIFLFQPIEGTDFYEECLRHHLDTNTDQRIEITYKRSGVVFYRLAGVDDAKELSSFILSFAVGIWEPETVRASELGMDADDLKMYIPYNPKVSLIKESPSDSVNDACLVCIAKNEQHYIREWADWYFSVGFSRIIIYDNNDVGSSDDYAGIFRHDDRVEVRDVRGKETWQLAAYTDAYDRLRDSGYRGWVAYFDLDEYLTFEDPAMKIKDFLAGATERGFDQVLLNWMTMSDSGRVKWTEEPMVNRFTVPSRNKEADNHVKCIVRVTESSLPVFRDPHHVWDVFSTCNALYEKTSNEPRSASVCHKVAWIRHFHFKTIEEFCLFKMQNGWADTARTGSGPYLDFFKYNTLTEEKAEYMLDRIYNLQNECRKHGIGV